MVKERMDLLELLRKGGMDGDVDFLREALRVLVEGIMDAEVSSRIGAEYGERSAERVTQRNGYRSRAWDTRVGTMDLHIPKLREGSYFPSLLEPRRRSERALLAVIQQAYVEGVSTRRVDDLVKALGCEGISKSQVSRICQELDVVVDGFMGRPLDGGPYPYLWLDALTQKVREAGRIVNVSVVVATAVNGEGKREIIGMDVGTSEERRLLAGLPTLAVRQGPRRGGTGGIGRSSGTQGCHRNRLRWGQLAAAPHPLHDQPAHSGPQERSALGGHHGAHHLPAAVPSGSACPTRAGDCSAPGPVPTGRLSTGRGWCGRPGLLQLPRRPLEEDLGPTTPWSVSTRRYGAAPMRWASSLTGRPCAASLAPSWLSSTTNGPLAVDTRHPRSTASTKLYRRRI